MKFTDALMKLRERRFYPILMILFPPIYFFEVRAWLMMWKMMIGIPVIGLFLVPKFPVGVRGD